MLAEPPLRGTRVVEVGNYMAGPFCGMQLADLGAEVIKIEHPRGGDLARFLEPFVDGESGNFARLNRDKRSVAIDLKREKGQQIFRQLAKTADIIVENLRPGTMADLGLSPASLMEAVRAEATEPGGVASERRVVFETFPNAVGDPCGALR